MYRIILQIREPYANTKKIYCFGKAPGIDSTEKFHFTSKFRIFVVWPTIDPILKKDS